MNFFYVLILFVTLFISFHSDARMQRPYNLPGMLPRAQNTMPLNDREGMLPQQYDEAGMTPPKGYDGQYDESDMDYRDDQGLPPPRAPMTSRPVQGAPRPSARRGFQKSGGMMGPERLPTPALEENFEDDLNAPIPAEGPGEPPLSPGALEPPLPARNYPPRIPEPPKFGQTEWNQMDLHSLVDGRRG